MEKDKYDDWGKEFISNKVVNEDRGSFNPPISININNPINEELIIAGCKYVAENQSLDYEEFKEGLINLGCVFTIEDVISKYPSNNEIGTGLKKGDLACGAVVVINSRESAYSRSECKNRYLDEDNDRSLYNFIRVVTKDDSYTKEYVDSLTRQK